MNDRTSTLGEEFVPETQEWLNRLAYALVEQLDSPHRETWTQMEFTATRAELPEYGETHTMRLTVWNPEGDFPLMPRPAAIEACRELDRVSMLGGRPRWRTVRLLLRRAQGQVSFQCWWDYDPHHQTSGRVDRGE